jgi:hypothetical protein
MNFKKTALLGCVLAAGLVGSWSIAGCGDDDDATTTNTSDAGTTPTTTTTTTSTSTSTTDSGTPDAAPVTTLYERLGKRAGISAAIKETVEGAGGILAQPGLAAYFTIRTGGDGGALSAGDIEDCFTQFVAEAAGGPEVYAGYTTVAADGGAKGGFACRSMSASHAGLTISPAAFSLFVGTAAAKLTAAKVSSGDIATLGAALAGDSIKAAIIDLSRLDAGATKPKCSAFIANGKTAVPSTDGGGNQGDNTNCVEN